LTEQGRKTIAIIGGGASGLILAAHLLETAKPGLRVVLIEKGDRIGAGIAYAAQLSDHRLNVPAGRMGVFHDDPLHFWNWLKARHPELGESSHVFAPRSEYGAYLADIWKTLLASHSESGRLRLVKATCQHVKQAGAVLEVRLSDGTSIAAHQVVLATGHDAGLSEPGQYDAITGTGDAALPPPGSRIIILGTGLTMVDTWLLLKNSGHSGEIVAISRHGLLPLPHGNRRNPIQLDAADIPFGTAPSYFMRWVRDLVKKTEAEGGEWIQVIDGLRNFNQRTWMSWPLPLKKRFLRHAKAYWDVHRHRIAPDLHERFATDIAGGGLSIVAAKVQSRREHGDGVELAIRRRGSQATTVIRADRVFDCTGLIRNLAKTEAEPLKSLIAGGLIRPDPIGLSLDVASDCSVLDREGKASDRIYAIGPLTRGHFFEIEAVPDIREQCAALASLLTSRLSR
jgi:uncharacterized NAD(P)/FAD-binding protein YdhS